MVSQNAIKALLLVVVVAQLAAVVLLVSHLRGQRVANRSSAAALARQRDRELAAQMVEVEQLMVAFQQNYTRLLRTIDERRKDLDLQKQLGLLRAGDLLSQASAVLARKQQELQSPANANDDAARESSNDRDIAALIQRFKQTTPPPSLQQPKQVPPTITTTTTTPTAGREPWDTDDVEEVEDVEWLFEKPLDVAAEHLWRYKSTGLYWTRRDRLYRKFAVRGASTLMLLCCCC